MRERASLPVYVSPNAYDKPDLERMHRIVLEQTLVCLLDILRAEFPRSPAVESATADARAILKKWNSTLEL